MVDLLTGFLGSGKTTLLNRLLAQPHFGDTAVIVNELGEVGLDHLLVTERQDNVAVLESGCLCCTVIDSLPETLLDLCARRARSELPPFTRMIVETTGLADPGPVTTLLRRSALLAHFLVPGITVTAFDALFGSDQLERHAEARMQVVLADRIVLTKLDARAPLLPEEASALWALNPLAHIVTAADVSADPALLVAPMPNPRAHEAGEAAHHSHDVAAYSFALPEAATQAGLAAWANVMTTRFGSSLLRVKGVVRTRTGAVLIQGVRDRFAFETAPPAAAGGSILTCILQGVPREAVVETLHWLQAPEGSHAPC